jgi:hypothetical protein
VQAIQWLNESSHLPVVQRARAGVDRLFRSAGAPVEAFRLAGKNPSDRARAIWASLRVQQIDPLDVLAVWLGVDMKIRDDPQPDRHQEYRYVQVAKLLHRMRGGTHRRWEYEQADGKLKVTEMHKYPVSRGRILRVIGKQLADACDDLSVVE